jgi:hypothetical protein
VLVPGDAASTSPIAASSMSSASTIPAARSSGSAMLL